MCAKKPAAPSIRVETISIRVIPLTAVIARTGSGTPACSSTIKVPSDLILYEFLTRTGVPVLRHGNIERGCKTCEPK